MSKYSKSNFLLLLFFFVYVSILQIIVSPSSFLYALYNQVDIDEFFLEGRAWMDGSIPYVDFSDSKGPLLFLFYGVCSLISRYDFLGVYLLSCFWFTASLFLTYKIISLFSDNKRISLLATIVMSMVYFCPLWLYEFKSESMCLPFFLTSSYYYCKSVFADYQYADRERTLLRCAFFGGISVMCAFLIKFSIAAIVVLPIMAVCFIEIRSWKLFFRYAIAMLSGMTVIMLPFFIYFVCNCALAVAFDEYIVKTLETVSRTQGDLSYFQKMLHNIMAPSSFVLLVLGTISTIAFGIKGKQYGLSVFFIFAISYFITLQNGTFPYYYTILSPFVIFGIIAFVEYYRHLVSLTKLCFAIVVIFCSICLFNISRYFLFNSSVNNFLHAETQMNEGFKDIKEILTSLERRDVIFTEGVYEKSMLVSVDVRLAARYWFIQTGATQDMFEDQYDAIRSHKCNVCFVEKSNQKVVNFLKSNGFYETYTLNNYFMYVYK